MIECEDVTDIVVVKVDEVEFAMSVGVFSKGTTVVVVVVVVMVVIVVELGVRVGVGVGRAARGL